MELNWITIMSTSCSVKLFVLISWMSYSSYKTLVITMNSKTLASKVLKPSPLISASSFAPFQFKTGPRLNHLITCFRLQTLGRISMMLMFRLGPSEIQGSYSPHFKFPHNGDNLSRQTGLNDLCGWCAPSECGCIASGLSEVM